MIQKKIDESNEKLAKFLDWFQQEDQLEGTWWKKFDSSNGVIYSIHNNENYPHKDLPFRRDWNWLMEVLDKIVEVRYGYQLTPGAIMIFDWDKANSMSRFEAQVIPIHYHTDDRIVMVWNACVHFVEWYNKQLLEKKIITYKTKQLKKQNKGINDLVSL